MTPMYRVLFLCTGNSARSQMAEALVNALLGDRWQAFSAGTRPSGYVHPLALQVLREIGISHHGHSKSIAELPTDDFDLVITVCDAAAEECPLWLGAGKRVPHGYPDPASVDGSEEEQLQVFRQIRDRMLRELPELLGGWLREKRGFEKR
ncbi:MAG: arsenate reductase ArsC [Anaerolineales bacterium]